MSRGGHRRCSEVLRIRHGLNEPIRRVVIGVGGVPNETAGASFDGPTRGRSGGCRALHEGIGGIAPSDCVHRRTADDPKHHRATGCRKAAGVDSVRDRGVDTGAIRNDEVATRAEGERRRPAGLPRDRSPGRGHVDDFHAAQIDVGCPDVRDFGELVRSRGSARLDLGHDQGRSGPRDAGRHSRGLKHRRSGHQGHGCGKQEHEQHGRNRASNAFHRSTSGRAG